MELHGLKRLENFRNVGKITSKASALLGRCLQHSKMVGTMRPVLLHHAIHVLVDDRDELGLTLSQVYP